MPRAIPLRALWFRQFQTVRYHCVVSDALPLPGTSGVFRAQFETDEEPEVERTAVEMIAYTSGGTGVPKGVLFTPEMLSEQLSVFREVFGFAHGQVDLPLLPIFSLFDIALGITAIIPPLDPAKPLSFEPERMAHIIDEYRITSSFGSPTLWKKLSDWANAQGRSFPSLERVLIAGAPVTDEVLAAVKEVVPNGSVFVPYGATEALPVSVTSAADRLAATQREESNDGQQGLPIGRPIAGVAIQVMPVGTAATPGGWGEPCTTGEIGELWVSGPTVSPGYLHATGDLNAKRLVDGTRWHALGDVGYVGASGMVYFCGRRAHVVRTSRLLCPIPVERIVNQLAGVKRTALVSLGEGGAGIVVEPVDAVVVGDAARARELIERAQRALADAPLTAEITEVFLNPSFPVDGRHNAKIFRDRLSVWAQSERRARGKSAATR